MFPRVFVMQFTSWFQLYVKHYLLAGHKPSTAFVGGFVICFGSQIGETVPPPCRQGFSWGSGNLLKSASRFCFAQCKKCPRDRSILLHYLINI